MNLMSKALRYGLVIARGSHTFTINPYTNHTCLCSSAAERHRPLPGILTAPYSQTDGQAELRVTLCEYVNEPYIAKN